MIYCAFTYFNEKHLLDLNIEMSKDLVDVYVIAEGNQTFRGNPKGKNFPHEIMKAHGVEYRYECGDLGSGGAWQRENAQRQILQRLIEQEASPDDWVILIDVDEIVNTAAVKAWLEKPYGDYATISMDIYNYFYNLRVKKGWDRPKIMSVYKFLSGNPHHLRTGSAPVIIRNGGWHFSNVMTPDDFILKHKSFSHAERDIPAILQPELVAKAMLEAKDIFGLGATHFSPEVVDISVLPRAIQSNPYKYRDFLWENPIIIGNPEGLC